MHRWPLGEISALLVTGLMGTALTAWAGTLDVQRGTESFRIPWKQTLNWFSIQFLLRSVPSRTYAFRNLGGASSWALEAQDQRLRCCLGNPTDGHQSNAQPKSSPRHIFDCRGHQARRAIRRRNLRWVLTTSQILMSPTVGIIVFLSTINVTAKEIRGP